MVWGWLKSTSALLRAGTVTAPAGADVGPAPRIAAFPHTRAGGDEGPVPAFGCMCAAGPVGIGLAPLAMLAATRLPTTTASTTRTASRIHLSRARFTPNQRGSDSS